MKLTKVILISWIGLTRNKLRSLLTMLGVIIGVAAVIVMVSVSAGTEATIAEQINSLGPNLLFITQGFGGGGPGRSADTDFLTYEDMLAIRENIGGVEGVSTERSTGQLVKLGSVSFDGISIVGTSPDFPSVREVPVEQGRFFTQDDFDRTSKVAVLGYTLAEELFGETLPIGQKITVGNTKLTVIGVMEEKGLVSGVDYDMRLYTPLTVVNSKFTPSQFGRIFGDRVGLIFAQVAEEADFDDVILQIELLLAKRHDTTIDELAYNIQTQQDIIETQEATTAAFRSLLAWVAGVSLLVGGIGIMNIMLVSVTERTREIGIRQAIGATPKDIRQQFLTEAIMLSLAGGILGVIVGIIGSWLFGETGELRTVILPSSILLAVTSALAVGIFFGYYPAKTASELDPIEALRHE